MPLIKYVPKAKHLETLLNVIGLCMSFCANKWHNLCEEILQKLSKGRHIATLRKSQTPKPGRNPLYVQLDLNGHIPLKTIPIFITKKINPIFKCGSATRFFQ